MARLELEEREVAFSQSALDRRDGTWHVYTNDPYWHRRLERVDAKLVREVGDDKWYTVTQRQLLVRRVPAPRSGPRVVKFLEHRKSRSLRTAVEAAK